MQFLRQQARYIIASSVVICLLLVSQYFGLLRPIERLFALVTQPLQAVVYQIITTIHPTYSAEEATLLEENTKLKAEISTAIVKNQELTTQLAQYQQYSKQLSFAQTKSYNTLPAEIISRVGQGINTQTITINRGSVDGIQVGYPIIYNDGILIGVVYDVEGSYSEVALIASGLVKVQGMINNENPTFGIIDGAFGTSLAMQYILKDQAINPEDVVVTNGRDEFIPKGLIIGTVQSVEDQASELFKTATVAPVLKYDTQSIVSVIIPEQI